jgi:hypothetical protein
VLFKLAVIQGQHISFEPAEVDITFLIVTFKESGREIDMRDI